MRSGRGESKKEWVHVTEVAEKWGSGERPGKLTVPPGGSARSCVGCGGAALHLLREKNRGWSQHVKICAFGSTERERERDDRGSHLLSLGLQVQVRGFTVLPYLLVLFLLKMGQ